MNDRPGDRWEILPALTLFRGVLFPGARCQVLLETVEAYGAVKEATRCPRDPSIAVFAARTRSGDAPRSTELFEIGAAAQVVRLERRPCCHRWIAELRATGRLRAQEHLQSDPFRISRIERLPDPLEDPDVLGALLAEVRDGIARIAAGLPLSPHARNAASHLARIADPSEATGPAMDALRDLPLEEQQRILELPLVSARLHGVLDHVFARLSRIGSRERRLLH